MIFGFWILANDEKSKFANLPKSAKDTSIPVGKKDNPIGRIMRSEIDDYLSPEFYKLYNIWKKFHLGLGVPMTGKPWPEQPAWQVETIELFQQEYISMMRG